MSPRPTALGLALGLSLLAAACGGGDAVPADVVDRETFIATYVDLRWAAIESPDFRISADQRDQILAARGVDGESLVRFADVHGRDLDFMNEVWAEVEKRVADRPSGDEAEPAAESPR